MPINVILIQLNLINHKKIYKNKTFLNHCITCVAYNKYEC